MSDCAWNTAAWGTEVRPWWTNRAGCCVHEDSGRSAPWNPQTSRWYRCRYTRVFPFFCWSAWWSRAAWVPEALLRTCSVSVVLDNLAWLSYSIQDIVPLYRGSMSLHNDTKSGFIKLSVPDEGSGYSDQISSKQFKVHFHDQGWKLKKWSAAIAVVNWMWVSKSSVWNKASSEPEETLSILMMRSCSVAKNVFETTTTWVIWQVCRPESLKPMESGWFFNSFY